MLQKPSSGKVILAGAGPGDPELLTLKALRFLQIADVVITDRLVSDVILNDFTNKEALILHAGKQAGRRHSTPQSTINELMIEYANQGKLVVRLKGGDSMTYSHIMDELLALVNAGVRYEIIPGVTAASGAAAYTGIPLTAREHANAVRFLTYYKKEPMDAAYWKELAQTSDTLVFYMSSDGLDLLLGHLIAHGISTEAHVAVVEQATTIRQKVFSCNVYEYANKWGGNAYQSPALVIIGKVVALHRQFSWLPDSGIREDYFKPLPAAQQAAERA